MYRLSLALVCVLAVFSCSDEVRLPSTPEKYPPSIICRGVSVNMEDSPEWCLSYSSGWVAFSNYDTKSQYYISWDGGMEPGRKGNPQLKISSNRGKPVSFELETLEINTDGVNYTVDFVEAGGESGRAVFSR